VSSALFSLMVLPGRRLSVQIEDDVFNILRSSSHHHMVAMCFLGSTEALHMMGEVLACITGPRGSISLFWYEQLTLQLLPSQSQIKSCSL
jgi:hypothetical protein